MYFEYNFSCNSIECMITLLICKKLCLVVSNQKITHLQKISYHNTSQRRYDIFQIKIRDIQVITRRKVIDNTSNKQLKCIESTLQDVLSISNNLVDLL